VKRYNQQQKELLREQISTMNPYKFEHLVGQLLEAMGYEQVEVTKASGDKGVDVVGKVQVKWFTEFGHLNRGDMLTSEQHRCHNEKRNFSAEFKRESAQLVVDQNYTVADAASAMDVGLSTMTRWVKQLRDERQGKTPKASPITPEQIEIRELRKKLQRIEMENEILKKATALLMSDSLNSSR
jgi:transposase-like protein